MAFGDSRPTNVAVFASGGFSTPRSGRRRTAKHDAGPVGLHVEAELEVSGRPGRASGSRGQELDDADTAFAEGVSHQEIALGPFPGVWMDPPPVLEINGMIAGDDSTGDGASE